MKFYKILVFIVAVFSVSFLFFNSIQPASAALVPCGLSEDDLSTPEDETALCTICDTLKLFSRIINYILFTLVPAIGVLLYLYAGFLILLGGANPKLVATGRSVFSTTTWGLVIIFVAWMVTNSVLKSIAGDSVFTKDWNKVVCMNPVEPPVIEQVRYDCNSENECVENPSGSYVGDPACGGNCTEVAPITKYSCSNNACVEDANGEYLGSDCDGACAAAPDPLQITNSVLGDGVTNQIYAAPVNASGGVGTKTYSVSGGALPTGLNLSSNGTISGTPTTAGSHTFTIKVEDSSNPKQLVTKEYTINIVRGADAVTISGVTISNITNTTATIAWVTNKPSNSQVEYGTSPSFGSQTQVYTIQSANHSVTIAGLRQGTNYSFRVKSGVVGFTAVSSNYSFKTTGTAPTPTQTITPTVTPTATPIPTSTTLSIMNSTLPDGSIGQAYSQTLSAVGGTLPRLFSLSSGTLPTGISLSTIGVLSGSPTTENNYTFTVKVEDSSNPKLSSTKVFTIKITQAPDVVKISGETAISITNTSAVVTWTTDKPATSQVEYATSGSQSVTLTPINNTLVVSHTVNLAGLTPGTDYVFRAKSSTSKYNAVSSTRNFRTTGTAPVASPLSITSASLPEGRVSTAYSQNLQASGGKATYIWSKTAGNLPGGLSLSAAGTIAGTPTTANTYTLTIKVEDSSNPKQSVTKELTLKINPASTGVAACLFSGINLCQGQPLVFSGGKLNSASAPVCHTSTCDQYSAALSNAAQRTGISLNLLRATIYGESRCQVGASNPGGNSYGLMQLQPATANAFKTYCGVSSSTNITSSWLTSPANATASICIAAYAYKSLADGSCGYSPRNILAGYSGGPTACQASNDCRGETSCDGSAVRKWECLYDSADHSVCNGTNNVDANQGGKYNETRYSVVNKLYCVNNPGSWGSSGPPIDQTVVISGVTASNITSTGAVITWRTDKPSTSQVEYSRAGVATGTNTPLNTGLTTNHSVSLTGLTSGTDYVVRVKSGAGGSIAVSSNYNFKTSGAVVLACPLQPLSALTDPQAQQMEGGQTLVWSSSNPQVQQNLTKLQNEFNKLKRFFPSATANSVYRPLDYQKHLYEIYQKSDQINDDPSINSNQSCRATVDSLNAEQIKHGVCARSSPCLVGSPSPCSPHVKGTGIDIGGISNYESVNDVLERNNIDLRWQGLSNDRVHFNLINPPYAGCAE